MDLTKLVFSIVETLWPLAINLWDAWGIQLLVLVSCFFQIILLTLGVKRRYSFNVCSRFTIWAFYLLASYIATFTLGKLTVVKLRDPENPDYNVGLKGLLAPLLLVHLANPDCIKAYSVEDNRLGIRQVLNLIVTIGFVIWILIRCWDSSSPVRWLYFPLFTAGVINSVGTVLALKSVYDDSTSVDEMKRYDAATKDHPDASGFLQLILMAYHRFDSLRPHQVNWLYHPRYIQNTWMSVDSLEPKVAFTVTEIELGFVFDVLYTKTPILYTKIGIVCKAIAFSCLISTLCGFSIIFRNAFLLDLYVTYTYALLMVSTIMELHQVCILPFSHWMVVKILDNENKLVNEKVLACIAKSCEKQRRWSNSIHQFNMVEYCSKGDWCSPVSSILRLFRLEERLKRYWRTTYKPIPSDLKDIVWENMKSMTFPIKTRGDQTLGRWEDRLKNQPDSEYRMKIMTKTLKKELGKSIITWHIATDILLRMSNSHSTSGKHGRVSQLLSNYMMYLLVRHPSMLSLTTSDITFGYACSILKDFAQGQELSHKIITLLEVDYKEEGQGEPKTVITERWKVLQDVKKLVYQLRNLESKWDLISSVWVEMLCFAAYHCQVYYHAQRLGKGGELITHVWLLLAHKTDKFPSDESEQDV